MNSLMLASAGALATLGLSALIAAAARATPAGRAALFAASAGYAAPGAAIALGALALFGAAREAGLVGGVSAALAIALLLWTYAARFAAAGAQPIEAGLARITPNQTGAARLLGAGPWRRLATIDLPIAGPSVLAAALIVFVEILKELPATLILRPFDFDTLAIIAYSYASDERLAQSAAPSLLITAAGLVPILFLSRRIETARAGAR
jgi:iron(III) transport system permease protein